MQAKPATQVEAMVLISAISNAWPIYLTPWEITLLHGKISNLLQCLDGILSESPAFTSTLTFRSNSTTDRMRIVDSCRDSARFLLSDAPRSNPIGRHIPRERSHQLRVVSFDLQRHGTRRFSGAIEAPNSHKGVGVCTAVVVVTHSRRSTTLRVRDS